MGSTNIAKLMDLFIEYQVAEGRNPRSFYILRQWGKIIGDRMIEDLQPTELISIVNRVTVSHGWSQQTRTHFANAISSLCKWAVKMGYSQSNPATLIPRRHGKALKNEVRFVLPPEKYHRLLECLEALEPRIRDYVETAASTGLRFGALASLSKSDVRQDENGDVFLEVIGKNGDPHRGYVFNGAKKAVERRMASPGKWLFGGKGRLSQKALRAVFPVACKMCDIPYGRGKWEMTPHGLRRFFASTLLNHGVSVDRVMSLGGWKSYAAVARYAYLNDSSRKTEFRKLAELL